MKASYLVMVSLALIAWSLAVASSRVDAAPASANVCEPVAAAGNIVVYRCEPDYGLPFYVNSVGFMAIED